MAKIEYRGSGAAVTGAAAGIGRALALELAREGCRVAISDVDEAGLDETAAAVRRTGAAVDVERVDVADREAVESWADRVVREVSPARFVFNNAGVTVSAGVEQLSLDDLAWLFRTNFWGVVHGTKAFLPHFRAAGEGCIVNVSSVFAVLTAPTQAPYSASKAAVLAFTDALAQELAVARSPVRAVAVIPGGVDTGLVRSGRLSAEDVMGLTRDEVVDGFRRLARTPADRAARAIIRGVRRGRPRVVVGADARLGLLAWRLAPGLVRTIFVRKTRRARAGRPGY